MSGASSHPVEPLSTKEPTVREFPPAAKQAVYDAIALRRDVRAFRPQPVPGEVLHRILAAAHRAGSVGLMQPWDFVVVRSAAQKARVYDVFRRANDRAATRWRGNRRARYAALKLQGILDAPLAVCVTCDTGRGGPHVLGRDTIRETDVYSTCLAVQNLWLAARAEGVGVGWVSIVDNAELAAALRLPDGVLPVAYLCVGYPVHFPDTPMLEATGWRARTDLADLVHFDDWDGEGEDDPLRVLLRSASERARGVSVDVGSRPDAAARWTAANRDPPASTASSVDTESIDPDASDAGSVDAESVGRRAVSIEPVGARSTQARTVEALAASVVPADADGTHVAAVRARLDDLAMPRGSLGALEALAVRLACAQGRDFPLAGPAAVLVFAGDHGVCAEGVSAYRAEVTARLCYSFVAGGGAVNALARTAGADVTVVDVGVDHDFEGATGLVHRKVARGTRNLATEDAMTRAEAESAILAGAASVRALGPRAVLALGEVGIGNTTSAAALLALLTEEDAESLVGAGTGVGARTWSRKAQVVARAVERCRGRRMDAVGMLAAVGGYEIAALAGAMLAAAAAGTAVVLDGFITGVAALVAAELAPAVRGYLLASHRSAERGHRIVLDRLSLRPLLELELRLGEASGAVLALPLVSAACAVLRDVRTFREAGMDEPLDPRGAT
ncbi:MAG: cob(II)yrinic acid a,c-diamide reductase [Gemmatimonadetes bacterium]|nr:cob(II)yrinic acid a,c-diamide reductase [Gemmatimonadota bacterium]